MNKIFTLLALICLAACNPKIKNLALYQDSPIKTAEFLPAQDKLASKDINIVILPFEEGDIKAAKQAQLGNIIATATENIISDSKVATIIDRDSIDKLKDEVAISEIRQTGVFKGLTAADYAISGALSEASLQHRYIAKKINVNSRTGQITTIPPKHKYSAKVAGNIKIYSLPNLEAITDSSFFGFTNRVNTEVINKEDHGLLRKAAQDALNAQKITLSNVLSKLRTGYVIGKKTKGKKQIFRVSFGYDDGLKHGDLLVIFRVTKHTNPISNEVRQENIKLTNAVVTNQIYSDSAWVILSDKKMNSQIEIGNIVLKKYRKTIGAKIQSFTNSISDGASALSDRSSL